MPELPEIAVRACEMKQALVGKTIRGIEVLQPKCLNIPEETFVEALTGARLLDVVSHGKWLFIETTQGWLLLNLGMGGEILLVTRDRLPEKYRLVFDFDDGTCLAVNFWWFGYAHFARDLADHSMVSQLGPDFMSLTPGEFRELLRGRRGGIKSFLLDQKRIAGIGNVYVQDPLFKAGVHPLRPIHTLADDEIEALYRAFRETLQESIDRGGSHWELGLHGEPGRWGSDFFLVAYREGQPCPTCGTEVVKIRTGSTSGFVCPHCQPLA
ncbi:MAG: Fpg/Nei family DNA glycosylase [Chloroflexi bacterium]|nr:Fpg/Nei family DNA glycosylase [Chloroflexota bacterium]MBU1748640.1 Fpg/Nei family DNA glycosylase [Chloroflexota bacterium]